MSIKQVQCHYGMLSVSRDPIINSEVATKNYVDSRHVVGDIKYSVHSTNHLGWLICDGSSISRSDYAELFNIIGTSFGSDSSTTFNIPNCKGKVLGAIGTGIGLTARSIGDLVGEETHTMTLNELVTHSHTGTTVTSGSHTHGITDPGHAHLQHTINDDFNNSGGVGNTTPSFASDSAGYMTWDNIESSTTGITINNSGIHSHTFTTNTSGNSQAFNVMQPTIFLGNVFIFSQVLV